MLAGLILIAGVAGTIVGKLWGRKAAGKVADVAQHAAAFAQLAREVWRTVENLSKKYGWSGPEKFRRAALKLERKLGRKLTRAELTDFTDTMEELSLLEKYGRGKAAVA